ncbi:ABC transporter ATP-binding protein [Arachnia propionica]|uniref:ABC transporter ATP-binding protein n=1 Tax=Arachnia propionica TaxID=1750 RepID=A0A3P1T906_9ACTN|nr:ABC transporter ATP-binding protein [Arachnia propionica]RRD05768.1 ABC transporter ATP-binding protein [Arachnia propionica]
MTTPVIECHSIIRRYGRGENSFTALKGIDLSVGEGESVAVIGKSGSGKSTLMHIMALLDRPTSGAVSVRGVRTDALGARRLERVRNEEFGFVFQQFFLIAGGSVLDNVTLPLTIAGVRPAERRRRGMEVLEQLDIVDKARSAANKLSGGQKQRLVIARALITAPSVIFADEPTGNLDTSAGRTVWNLLAGLNREHGITLILVTHDPDLAARCGRQVVIHDGRLAQGTGETR